jgi:N-acetylmuramoyl-L-alanine amidase
MASLGWGETRAGGVYTFSAPSGSIIVLTASTPLFTLDGVLMQFAFPPFTAGGTLRIPVQLFGDFLPQHFPERYSFDGPTLTLRAGPPPGGAETTSEPPVAAAAVSPAEGSGAEPQPPVEVPAQVSVEAPAPEDPVRVVIIDAGHGGVDPGAVGPSGVREKTVALGIALALARRLQEEPTLEVHLLRDDDSFIELWDRGQLATEIRGDRPAALVSIHANSFPSRRSAWGFETYFLSEARTEHERRVAAMENAPVSTTGDASVPASELDFIFRELRNHDHQHWAEVLASNIQEELERIHPGPNRGVKQAPLAVLTNSLMPSVLVEVGYLSNPEEERLLSRESFQRDAADALGQAIVRFFEHYPPRSGGGGTQR